MLELTSDQIENLVSVIVFFIACAAWALLERNEK